MNRLFSSLALTVTGFGMAWADDWPQWLGENRDGTWQEEGVLERLPEEGPKVLWRAPVAHGYSGPAVAKGRARTERTVKRSGLAVGVGSGAAGVGAVAVAFSGVG